MKTKSKIDKKNIRIPFSRPQLDNDDINEVVKILRSDWLTSGPKVAEFEKRFAEYIGCRHAVALNSCTAALHLALILSGIKEGDEVITTPFTFTATVNTILYQNAKPVFVDIDKDTFNIDPDKIEEKINKKTRAIVILHYGGHPCNLDRIYSLAEKYNLPVIEDAAHAVGAGYKGKKIGGFGKLAAFSFHAVKNMTTGEGGMLTTNNKELARRARILRLQGMDKDAWARNSNGIPPWYYRILFLGYKYNMTDMQASLGISQLKKLDSFIEKRDYLSNIYDKYLNNIYEVITPRVSSEMKHARHLYPICLRTEDMRISRDDFISRLLEKGISTSVHFIPLHLQPFFRKNFHCKRGDFPVAEDIFKRTLSLPLYPGMSEKEVCDVVECIDEIVSKNRIS
jgi:UDP-4-amino-4,6-dideoxy-N-acetyl-beta-L-altrosamine transaminase